MSRLKYLSSIFICLLAVLLMSHNVFAVDFSSDVYYVRSSANATLTMAQSGSGCTITGSKTIIYGSSSGCHITGLTIDLPYSEYLAGDIIEIDIVFAKRADNDALNSSFIGMRFDNTSNNNAGFALLGIDVENYSQNTGIAKFYARIDRYVSNQATIGLSGQLDLFQHENITVNTSCWRFKGDSSQAIINAINNSTTDVSGVENKLDDVIDAIQDQAEQQAEYQQQEQQAIENAVEDSQDAGDSAQSDSVQATSSLLGVITGFVGVISSASPSNCVINGNLGNVNLGNLDLCANPVPSFVQIIGSIISIMFFIPFAIHYFNKFISITRSFQS